MDVLLNAGFVCFLTVIIKNISKEVNISGCARDIKPCAIGSKRNNLLYLDFDN